MMAIRIIALRNDIFELFASSGEYVVVREENINAMLAMSSPGAIYLFFQSFSCFPDFVFS